MHQTAARFIQLLHASGQLLTALAVLGGIAMGLVAIHFLMQASDPQRRAPHSLRTVGLALVACGCLLNIGYTVNALRQTEFVSDGAYPSGAQMPTMWRANDAFSSDNETVLMATLVTSIFAFVGYSGIVRGIFMLPRIGRPPQPAELSKVFAFLFFGGLMLEPAKVASGIAWLIGAAQPMADFLSKAV